MLPAKKERVPLKLEQVKKCAQFGRKKFNGHQHNPSPLLKVQISFEKLGLNQKDALNVGDAF